LDSKYWPGAFVHRELVLLCVLIAIAAVGFFLTRGGAASNRETSLRDAAQWYVRGREAQAQGRLDDAAESFRRATARDRTNQTYTLALARALSLNHDNAGARALLMTLRESTPENAEINLELARLAARNADVAGALRFYHNALYAPWAVDRTDDRRAVRFELVRFLLDQHQAERALPELLAAAGDLPDTASAHETVGALFAEAYDQTHALDQFQRALRISPNDSVALAGAGRSAFRLGDLVLARTYLMRALPSADVMALLALVEQTLADDPLASRIGSGERERRVRSDLDYARQRLTSCVSGTEDDLETEADEFSKSLERPTSAVDRDAVESGVELIDRMARHLVERCGPATTRDQALALIGHRHNASK
jgi:Tfp pilus assembly protein PilF